MIISGYQTLEDRDNIDEIEIEGPYICNDSNAWLGLGYYFWDTKIEWAKKWGQSHYVVRGKEFVIAHCQLDLTNCFDLVGNIQHQDELIECISVIKNRTRHSNEPKIPDLIEFLKKNGLFKYDSIRSSDNPIPVVLNYNSKTKEYITLNQRVQVCVINRKTVLLRPFKVIFPEKYLY